MINSDMVFDIIVSSDVFKGKTFDLVFKGRVVDVEFTAYLTEDGYGFSHKMCAYGETLFKAKEDVLFCDLMPISEYKIHWTSSMDALKARLQDVQFCQRCHKVGKHKTEDQHFCDGCFFNKIFVNEEVNDNCVICTDTLFEGALKMFTCVCV